MLDKGQIEQIVKGNDIVNTISKYIQLKKHGNNHLGLCPFHNDSNALLTVSSTKQFFKCFSCGKSSNVLNFIQKIEKNTFIETLNIAANNDGLSFTELKSFESYANKKQNQKWNH